MPKFKASERLQVPGRFKVKLSSFLLGGLFFQSTAQPYMEVFFLSKTDSRRLCIFHTASADRALGAVIYVHPFAEELNKTRRMAALQARAMAEAGYDVLQIDLFGCGDSAGDFGDATWQVWREDVLLAYRWLRGRSDAPLILWGLRAGCLLAASAAVDLPERAKFIFWQPVVSGKQHWRQFLRLGRAANMLSGQRSRATGAHMPAEVVEIAGYHVSSELAESLHAAELIPPPGQIGRLAWLAISNQADAAIEQDAQAVIEQWQACDFDVATRIIHGPAFWQTAEIEEVPELLTATLSILETWR